MTKYKLLYDKSVEKWLIGPGSLDIDQFFIKILNILSFIKVLKNQKITFKIFIRNFNFNIK